jgi:hypothetical protein
MNSREIILANINHENPPRCGLTFDRGRMSDMLGCGLRPHGYTQKRWVEGKVEYYDVKERARQARLEREKEVQE